MSFFPENLQPVPAMNDLGPGRPVRDLQPVLTMLDIATIFAPKKIVDRSMADACHAGLLLRFDFLDESHTISQSIHTPTGSFWHGIMHRREPDYDNAKYWFRRVGDHPVFSELCAAAKEIAGKESNVSRDAQFLIEQDMWDPFRFVDLVAKSVRGGSDNTELCKKIQLREWELLFDYCCKAAVGE